MADTTKQTPDCTNPKGLSLVSTALLGLASLGLVACSSGSSSTDTGGGGETPVLEKVSIADAIVAEGDTGTQSLVFTVSISAAVADDVTVVYTTADDTAEAVTDYTAATDDILTIPAGDTSATITIDVAGDTEIEADETLTLTLSAPSGIALGVAASATGTIINDDNANPAGLYKSGTVTLNGVTASGLVGFVDNKRMLFFSVADNILIDGTIDTLSGNDYTATVTLYVDGVAQPNSISVTGLVASASQISGTMGTDNFTLLFDPLYTRGATIARIETDTLNKPWVGSVMMKTSGMSVNNLSFSATGNYVNASLLKLSPQTICLYGGKYSIPEATVNIYTTQGLIEQGFDCDSSLFSKNYEGLAAVIDGSVGVDSTLLFATTDGANAVFGIFTR